MGEIKKKVSEVPSDRRGYISGVKYYYGIIMREKAVAQDSDVFRNLIEFGVELDDLSQYEDSTSVLNLSNIFDKFYPEGSVHPLFTSLHLETELDGISECLYKLKKLYHLERWS